MFGALILYFSYISLLSLRNRTEMSIKKKNGGFTFRSPKDHYGAEKQYDRKFILELSSVFEQIGINVEYRGLVPPSTPTQPTSHSMTQPDGGRIRLDQSASKLAFATVSKGRDATIGGGIRTGW